VAQSSFVTIKALLFDLDGTLLDHESASAIAATRSLSGSDPAYVIRRWAELEHEVMDRYFAGELTFTEQRRVRIITLAGELGLGTWDTVTADDWFTGYLQHYRAAWRLYPDVRPAIQRLPYRLGVLTNGDAEQQRAKLRHLGLMTELPFVVASGEVGVAKPSPEIFRIACERLDLPPADVAYVGDRLHTDAIAASAAGLHGIWLDRNSAPQFTDLPRISTLNDLPGLLQSR
jgi:putative hydrolase of the HAD superfamily